MYMHIRTQAHSNVCERRELTERTWQCSYLPHIALPCDSQPYQAAQSLGARGPFISQSALQLSSGTHTHTLSPLLSPLSSYLLSSPSLSISLSALSPLCLHLPLLTLQLFVPVPVSSIVFLSGTVSHRFNVRCSLTVLNKSFFPLPGGDRAHVSAANHNHHCYTHPPTHTHIHIDTEYGLFMCGRQQLGCVYGRYKRYSSVGCWWLLGRFTPSLHDRFSFPTPTCIF